MIGLNLPWWPHFIDHSLVTSKHTAWFYWWDVRGSLLGKFPAYKHFENIRIRNPSPLLSSFLNKDMILDKVSVQLPCNIENGGTGDSLLTELCINALFSLLCEKDYLYLLKLWSLSFLLFAVKRISNKLIIAMVNISW